MVFVLKRFWKIVKKEKFFIIYAGIFGFLIFFIIDPAATNWGAWGFDYSKTLGIYFRLSVVEELIWAMLVSMIGAVAVAIAASKEEKGEKFHISDLLKHK